VNEALVSLCMFCALNTILFLFSLVLEISKKIAIHDKEKHEGTFFEFHPGTKLKLQTIGLCNEAHPN
jgi:hypothetical protein